eukprot:SAG22_NODE_8129_length_680_cov_1.332186_2_plen_73_part_01
MHATAASPCTGGSNRAGNNKTGNKNQRRPGPVSCAFFILEIAPCRCAALDLLQAAEAEALANAKYKEYDQRFH